MFNGLSQLKKGLSKGAIHGLNGGRMQGLNSGLNPRTRKYSTIARIVIDKSKCGASDLTNFPVCVSLNNKVFANIANGGRVFSPNGYDILFFSDAGCTSPLFFELEYYNVSGIFVAWVNVPKVYSNVDTVFYMKFGIPSVAISVNSTSAWDSNFKSVYHLPNGTTLTSNDSTSNAANGTLVNTPTPVSGKIDGGASFVGASNQYINLGAQNIGITYTASLWVNPSANGTILISDRDVIYVGNQMNLVLTGGYVLRLYIKNTFVTSVAALTANVWNKVGVTYASNTVNFWINGIKGANQTLAQTPAYNAGVPLWLASQSVAGVPNSSYSGILDEVKISNIVRSDDWMLTEYNNESSPSTFYSVQVINS